MFVVVGGVTCVVMPLDCWGIVVATLDILAAGSMFAVLLTHAFNTVVAMLMRNSIMSLRNQTTNFRSNNTTLTLSLLFSTSQYHH